MEIQEANKKYDFLLRESEGSLTQMKLELVLHFNKAHANKLLIDTLNFDVHNSEAEVIFDVTRYKI